MPNARPARSSTIAVAVGLAIAAMIGSAPPAAADALAVTSFSCDAGRDFLMCDAYFSGGSGGNTYWWSEAKRHFDSPDHTKAVVPCYGDSTQVTVSATDSSGTTVSASGIFNCFHLGSS
jgi:hypothetical protein